MRMSFTAPALCILCVCFAVVSLMGQAHMSAAPGNENSLRNEVIEQEKQELDCLKSGNMKLFASLIADDAVFVNPRGAAGKAQVVENTSQVLLEEYAMEEVHFVRVSSESGLISYKLTERGSAHGQPFSGQVYASALWAKRDGKWVCLFSQETIAK